MIITEIDAPLFLPEPDEPRSIGVHLSGIIKVAAVEAGLLKNYILEELKLVDVSTITDRVALVRISIGLAWEQYYIPRILQHTMQVADHPGEVLVDGIYMTPDGESVSCIYRPISQNVIITPKCLEWALGIHEVKATYKSYNTVKDIASQWMWMCQLMSYCKAKNTTLGYLHVLFLCGDYKYPIRPQLRCWQIEFAQSELDANWELITGYKRYREIIESGE